MSELMPHWRLIHRGMPLSIVIFQAQGTMKCVEIPMSWERTLMKCLDGNGSESVELQGLFFLSLPRPSYPRGTGPPSKLCPQAVGRCQVCNTARAVTVVQMSRPLQKAPPCPSHARLLGRGSHRSRNHPFCTQMGLSRRAAEC